MSAVAKFGYVNSSGNACIGELGLEDYKRAFDRGMTVRGYLNAKYSDAHPKFGSAYEQGLESLGIFKKSDPNKGILATKIIDMLEGTTVRPEMAGESLAGGGIIVSPSQQGTTPATRIFFPEVVMDLLNETLQTDYTREQQIWSRMIGSQETIPEDMYTQPYVNIEAPGNKQPGTIAQNSLPETLVSITTSQKSYSVPVHSIGLQISDQAVRRSSLDLVSTILAKHTKETRQTMMWDDILKITAGNLDSGDAALTAVKLDTIDTAIGTATQPVSQKAWIKILWDPTRAISIDSAVMDLDTFLLIEGRSGRPVRFDPTTSGANKGDSGTYGINAEPNLMNVELGIPNVLIVPTAYIGAGKFLLMDSSSALRRVVSSTASYQAIEQMVLQRTTFMRFDFGEITHRLYDDACKFYDTALT